MLQQTEQDTFYNSTIKIADTTSVMLQNASDTLSNPSDGDLLKEVSEQMSFLTENIEKMPFNALIIILLSIIMAIAFGELIKGWMRMFIHNFLRKNAMESSKMADISYPSYFSYYILSWSILAFLAMVEYWWMLFDYRELYSSNLFIFFIGIFSPLLHYALASILFPKISTLINSGNNLEQYYHKFRRIVYLVIAFHLIFVIMQSKFFEVGLHSEPNSYLFIRVIILALVLVGAIKHKRGTYREKAYDKFVISLCFIGMIYFMYERSSKSNKPVLKNKTHLSIDVSLDNIPDLISGSYTSFNASESRI